MVEEPSHVKQLSLNHVCKIGLNGLEILRPIKNLRDNCTAFTPFKSGLGVPLKQVVCLGRGKRAE
jgi:hypothetical protein